MKVKEESERDGLKLSIQKAKIIAFGPISSWQLDEEAMGTVRDFIFFYSKITVDGDWSHEIKRCLLLGRKSMINLDSVLKKQKHYFANRGLSSQSCGFSNMFMYGCESWTIKKAECVRIHAFELWRWKRLLRVPWDARRSNQSILKEINPECSLEGVMVKLKLQYFVHLMWIANSLEKTLMLRKIEGKRRRGWQDEMFGWHH